MVFYLDDLRGEHGVGDGHCGGCRFSRDMKNSILSLLCLYLCSPASAHKRYIERVGKPAEAISKRRLRVSLRGGEGSCRKLKGRSP